MFLKTASQLAGVPLTKAELETAETKVTAAIVDHAAAPLPEGPQGPAPEEPEKEGGCSVM
jgi:hypothetical protein